MDPFGYGLNATLTYSSDSLSMTRVSSLLEREQARASSSGISLTTPPPFHRGPPPTLVPPCPPKQDPPAQSLPYYAISAEPVLACVSGWGHCEQRPDR